MTKFVVDAYAWIEYLAGSREGAKVERIFQNKGSEIYTSSVTIAEVVSKIKRENRDWETAFRAITGISKPMAVAADAAKDTGLLHAGLKKRIPRFGLADAFVLQLARDIKAKILTGDPHFAGFDEAIMINR